MKERDTQLKATMDYMIDKADKDFLENFRKLQEGGLEMGHLNGMELHELKEFHRMQTIEQGGLTAYKLPDIRFKKFTKFIPDKDAPAFRSFDEIDLKF